MKAVEVRYALEHIWTARYDRHGKTVGYVDICYIARLIKAGAHLAMAEWNEENLYESGCVCILLD